MGSQDGDRMDGRPADILTRPRYLLRLAFALFSGIPTQVVVPSVSRAAVPHGTALTVRVDPSGATTFKPGP